MKQIVLLMMLFFYVKLSSAQLITTPAQLKSNAGEPGEISIAINKNTTLIRSLKPLYILFSHNKTIVNADTLKGFQNLPPQYIKTVNILQNSLLVKKYGEKAKNGVVEFYLDDEKYPDAFDSLKRAEFKIVPKPKYTGKMIKG